VKINAIITEATGGISHPKPREIFHTDFFNLTPFDAEKAAQKVRLAEDAWNTRNPVRVSLAYTHDCVWRNRSEFLTGRDAIVQFLTRKWNKELDYRLIKELWAFQGNRIAVRFAYEWRDDSADKADGPTGGFFSATSLPLAEAASSNPMCCNGR
jgi:nuclear transport factor 2 (NTF2) superfamily protein